MMLYDAMIYRCRDTTTGGVTSTAIYFGYNEEYRRIYNQKILYVYIYYIIYVYYIYTHNYMILVCPEMMHTGSC